MASYTFDLVQAKNSANRDFKLQYNAACVSGPSTKKNGYTHTNLRISALELCLLSLAMVIAMVNTRQEREREIYSGSHIYR